MPRPRTDRWRDDGPVLMNQQQPTMPRPGIEGVERASHSIGWWPACRSSRRSQPAPFLRSRQAATWPDGRLLSSLADVGRARELLRKVNPKFTGGRYGEGRLAHALTSTGSGLKPASFRVAAIGFSRPWVDSRETMWRDRAMIHDREVMMATEQERRSGLPGLGGRPKRHPAWGEMVQSAPIDPASADGSWRRRSATGDDRLDVERVPR